MHPSLSIFGMNGICIIQNNGYVKTCWGTTGFSQWAHTHHRKREGESTWGLSERYMEFVKPYKKQIFVTVLIGIIKFSIPLALPLLLKYVVDDIIQGGGTASDKNIVIIHDNGDHVRHYF